MPPSTPIYLDCAATTPVAPEVAAVVMNLMVEDYGNAGSRTHEFGSRAKQAVGRAREAVASVVGCSPDEVIFTSGATESNNLAILGLAGFGAEHGRRHIVSTQIEHKAVLEPVEALGANGFEITLVPPTGGGWVDPEAIEKAMRPDTLLVSVMQVNNETGVVQPLGEICHLLADHPAYFHVDASQGFGKGLPKLPTRADLISISGHKVFAPKGVGALIARLRGYERPPLRPLTFGGGQERGLRPGTLSVPLIAGLGKAAQLAERDAEFRLVKAGQQLTEAFDGLSAVTCQVNGDRASAVPWILNVSIVGVDSEASLVALKDLVAASNGSACTSALYKRSHVLEAMGLPNERINSALRFSWCHLTPVVDWLEISGRFKLLQMNS